MFQGKEIGKYRKRQSVLDAKIGRTYITPDNNEYSLISADKVGRSRIYVYEWRNCPEDLKKVVSNRLQSKTELDVRQIMDWIDSLKKEFKKEN